MGNETSRQSLRCGLCYFDLKEGAQPFEEPTGSRRHMPNSIWSDGLSDNPPQPPDVTRFVQIRTKPCSLQNSAGRGCVGCTAIWQAIGDQVRDKGCALDEKCMQGLCQLFWLVGSRESHSPSLQVQLLVDGGENLCREETLSMTLCYTGRAIPHPCARKVSQAVSRGWTGSPASLRSLKLWLEECNSAHKTCNVQTGRLPARVLELSGAPEREISVRLVQNSKQMAPYVCLSHRWGEATHRCRTTKDTLDAHQNSVPWVALPKTFQEAAIVTVFLGLKYLWIDSLCIVQDDKDDWRVQAAQMCSIYQGSYLTIAAASATDSDGGIFMTVPAVLIPRQNPRQPAMFLRRSPRHMKFSAESIRDYEGDFSLVDRGWVYQERLLAPRTVHFTRFELSFECANPYSSCECGLNDFFIRKRDHNRYLGPSELPDIRRNWHRIVEEYSRLHLTFQSDRLPALTGIASQYAVAHSTKLGRYTAGLWERTLAYDLLWYVPDGTLSRRTESYCGPSWSWVSVTRGVRVLSVFKRVTDDLGIQSFRVNPSGPDEHGSVTSAELILTGCLALGSLDWGDIHGLEEPGWHVRACFRHHNSAAQYFHMDYGLHRPEHSRHIPRGSPIYCLRTGFIGDNCHVCLVVRASDESQSVFERIGLMHEAQREVVDTWFEDGQREDTITVI